MIGGTNLIDTQTAVAIMEGGPRQINTAMSISEKARETLNLINLYMLSSHSPPE